jgi:phytoene dehydrogenase-like protein
MTAPIIIIGGGHNGLTTAAYLAKSGRKVVLLEANSSLGGLAGGETFHPGHRSLGVLTESAQFRPWIAQELGLGSHGLAFSETLEMVTGHADGESPIYSRGSELSGAVSPQDREDYAQFTTLIERLRGPILKLLDRAPLNPRGSVFPLVGPMLSIRALGAKDMTALMRIPPMCVADWMRDSFNNERLSALVAHDGLLGNMAGPWSPWTSANLLFKLATTGRPVIGGSPQIVDALVGAAEGFGVTIRTGAKVDRVILGSAGITGVKLETGETLDASAVFASCDPKTLFGELIGPRYLSTRLAESVHRIRTRGVTATLDLALNGALKDVAGETVSCIRIGSSLDDLEQAFDPVKYRAFPKRPMITLRTGATGSKNEMTACAHIQFVPHRPEGGWTDDARTTLKESTLTLLERACPGLKSMLLADRLKTPKDLAEDYGLSGGHLFHGEHAPDQLLFMRPNTACAEYTTPIDGLYLCGSGSHPGGGVTGAPGALSARRLLKG